VVCATNAIGHGACVATKKSSVRASGFAVAEATARSIWMTRRYNTIGRKYAAKKFANRDTPIGNVVRPARPHDLMESARRPQRRACCVMRASLAYDARRNRKFSDAPQT
jgi:hypothetical protein